MHSLLSGFKSFEAYLVICFFCACIAAYGAHRKNRNTVGWFFIGFLGNLPALYALKTLPVHIDPWDQEAIKKAKEEQRKKNALEFCYYCGEEIQEETSICPKCNKKL